MQLSSLCEQVIAITKQAGHFIGGEAAKFNTEAVEYKGVNNVVSYVDKQAELFLVEKLGALLPEAGFITEEDTVVSDRSKEWVWIIDPLDGTANFVHGLPMYSVSVGLMHNGKMVVGVVYHVSPDQCYYAWKDGGAFCNGNPIHVSKSNTLGESLLATGFPYYEFSKMPEYLDVLQHLMRVTHGLRRFGSAAIDLALVASGKFDGFYEYNLNSWDMAAGILLVQEAGGIVSDFSGGDNFLFGGDVIASNPFIHSELSQAIQSRW